MKDLVRTLQSLDRYFRKAKPVLRLDKAPETTSQKVIFETFNTMLDHVVEPIKLSSMKGRMFEKLELSGAFLGNLQHESLISKGLTQTLESSSIYRRTNSAHQMSDKVGLPGESEFTVNVERLYYLAPSPSGARLINKSLEDKENFSLPLLPISISLPCGSLEQPGDLEYFGQSAGYILATYENYVFTKLLKQSANLTEYYGEDLADIYSAVKREKFKDDILIVMPQSMLKDSERLSEELNHSGEVKYLFVPDSTLKGLNITALVLEKSGDFNVHAFQRGNISTSILEIDNSTVLVQVQAFIGYSMSGQANACIVKYNYNLQEMHYEFM